MMSSTLRRSSMTALALLLASCGGYSTASLYRDDVRTVAVPILGNDTFHRELGADLTEALIKAIESRTPWRVVHEASADTVLSGRVRMVELQPISQSPTTGLAQEVLVRMRVDFEWTDLRTGEPLVIRRDFEGTALFTPSAPAREPLEHGQFLVVQELAHEMVDELQAGW